MQALPDTLAPAPVADSLGSLRASVDSLAEAVSETGAALAEGGSGELIGTLIQLAATALAAWAAVSSWLAVKQAGKAEERAANERTEERKWRRQGIDQLYYGLAVRDPIGLAVNAFRQPAKKHLTGASQELRGLSGLTNEGVNDRAREIGDRYLSAYHQPLADGLAEAAMAWKETPELAEGLRDACAEMEELVMAECSKLPVRDAPLDFAVIVDRHVGEIIALVKKHDPAWEE